jgi:signal transduction histidine kinase
MIIASETDRIDTAVEPGVPRNGHAGQDVAHHNGHANPDAAPHNGHANGESRSRRGGRHNGHANAAPNAAALHAATRLLARERWRMAADVHDLIMQDLSLALANARALSDDSTPASRAGVVVSALERALAGARDVLGGLAEHDARPIALTIEASVRAAARHTPLRFDAARVSTSAQPDPPTREALVHIAREAVTNAVKHARPTTIEVVLEHSGRWRLTVHDDGRGFEEATAMDPTAGGFGLLSMRESAHALGGAVHVGSAAGAGTTVEAVLP